MNKKLIIVIVAVVALAVVAFFLLLTGKYGGGPTGQGGGIWTPSGAGTSAGVATEPASGLGGQLFDQGSQNPATKIPNTNPIQNDLNPYKSGYVNPFK